MSGKPTLIADLDGTLVKCGRYYNAANDDTATVIATEYGVDKALARELIEFLDVWAIRAQVENGFTRERYPRSTAAAVAAAGAIMTGDIHHAHVYQAFKRADAVFDSHEPFDGAADALIAFKRAGYQIIILTKGDQAVQQKKLVATGLDELADACIIVPKKSADVLRDVCASHDIDIAGSIYIGDSIRDDMVPANHLGMYAVRVETQPEDVWVHEETLDVVSDLVVKSVADFAATQFRHVGDG